MTTDQDTSWGISSAFAEALVRAKAALRRNDGPAAERDLIGALAWAPQNAQALRLLGSARAMQGRYSEAALNLRAAIELQPQDALAHNSLGNVLGLMGDKTGAAAAFARACALAPEVSVLQYNYAKALCEDGRNEQALPVLESAVRLAPNDARMQLLQADTLRVTGHVQQATDCYRKVLANDRSNAEAWFGLASLKKHKFEPVDVAAMEELAGGVLGDVDRASISFALACGYEDVGRYADAFRTYLDGNAQVRRRHSWNAEQFSAAMAATLAAFPSTACAANGQGSEVIFVVSLPRSGSSLIEQILASHPQVNGAGELPCLPMVLREESQRRGQQFPLWASKATAADWQRLGERYLECTARWRDERPRFTDKLPGNWQYAGAALAMLPGARVVICRRDPLETAFSCLRHLFSEGNQLFSYHIDDIASYLRDFHRAVAYWRTLYPANTFLQDYEALVANTEGQIRALLDFCDLSFDERCLRFHETERTVRTASAGQVREPLRADTARTTKYGNVLDPLRTALGLAPIDQT